MSNIIIECRNKEADLVVSNGDWTTTLQESLTLNNGDSIFVKNSFIDTQATSSQKIIIPQDINIEMDIGFYKNLNNITGLEAGIGVNPPAPVVNFGDYVLCILKSSVQDEFIIQDLSFTRFNSREINKAVDIIITYTDYDGVVKNVTEHIKENISGSIEVFSLKGVLSQTELIFEPTLDVLKESYNIKLDTFNFDLTNGKTVAIPYTQKLETIIPQGNYDPDDLCELINSKFSVGILNGFYFGGDNLVLLNSEELQSEYRTPTNTNKYEFTLAASNEIPTYYISSMKNFNSTNAIWLGTNQFELAFNSSTKTFQWNYLHFPYYYQKNLAVGYIKDTTNNTWNTASRNGGIYFTSLQAQVVTYANPNSDPIFGEPFNFWQGLLGFNNEEILLNFSWGENTYNSPTTYVIPTPDFSINNTTDGLATVDAQVDKTSVYTIPTAAQLYSSLSTDQTRKIIAGQNALNVENSFGYYVIEIGSKFKNNFYTPDNNYRNIQSIVSRYYSLDSYTSGTEQGSLIYQHKGTPQILEAFRCRILDSDKNLATNIGEDNTLHISIVRAPNPQLTMPPPGKKEDKEKK